jgi:hypothetical protein
MLRLSLLPLPVGRRRPFLTPPIMIIRIHIFFFIRRFPTAAVHVGAPPRMSPRPHSLLPPPAEIIKNIFCGGVGQRKIFQNTSIFLPRRRSRRDAPAPTPARPTRPTFHNDLAFVYDFPAPFLMAVQRFSCETHKKSFSLLHPAHQAEISRRRAAQPALRDVFFVGKTAMIRNFYRLIVGQVAVHGNVAHVVQSLGMCLCVFLRPYS